MSNSFNVRLATREDIPAIQNLISNNLDSLLPRSDAELVGLLGVIWIAEDEEQQLIGSAILEVYSPKIAEVRSVAVKEAYRKHGIGKMLVAACVEEAKKRKIPEVFAITSRLEFFDSVNFKPCLNNEKYAVFWNGDSIE